MPLPRDFDRTLHNNWDREQEGNLPDSRLSGPRRRATTIVRGGMKYERVFCANCSAEGGYVTADWSPHVFYICDDCFHTAGAVAPPGTAQVDESLVRGTKPSGE